jgi:hypothetical protein
MEKGTEKDQCEKIALFILGRGLVGVEGENLQVYQWDYEAKLSYEAGPSSR